MGLDLWGMHYSQWLHFWFFLFWKHNYSPCYIHWPGRMTSLLYSKKSLPAQYICTYSFNILYIDCMSVSAFASIPYFTPFFHLECYEDSIYSIGAFKTVQPPPISFVSLPLLKFSRKIYFYYLAFNCVCPYVFYDHAFFFLFQISFLFCFLFFFFSFSFSSSVWNTVLWMNHVEFKVLYKQSWHSTNNESMIKLFYSEV